MRGEGHRRAVPHPGGLAVDATARVRRPDGSLCPISSRQGARRWGCQGPMHPPYLSGNGLLTAVVLGRIAGGEAGPARPRLTRVCHARRPQGPEARPRARARHAGRQGPGRLDDRGLPVSDAASAPPSPRPSPRCRSPPSPRCLPHPALQKRLKALKLAFLPRAARRRASGRIHRRPRRASEMAHRLHRLGRFVIVLQKEAALFVDGRYTLQAPPRPTPPSSPAGTSRSRRRSSGWPRRSARANRVGFDPRVTPMREAERWRTALAKVGAELVAYDGEPDRRHLEGPSRATPSRRSMPIP